jgi:predicted permease
MRTLRSWIWRLGGLFHKGRRDLDFAEELDSHLQLHIEDNVRAGLAPDEARRQAVIALGGVEQTKENYRDRRGLPFLEAAIQDVRFGLRLLRKNPGFTAVAVLTLALGIGANTAIFSVIENTLLHPVPWKDPDRILSLLEIDSRGKVERQVVSPANFLDWRGLVAGEVFDGVAAWNFVYVNLTGGDQPEQVEGLAVTADYFHLLGFQAAQGRTFQSDEDHPRHAHTVILSHNFWHRRFAANPTLIGRSLEINGEPFTVIGILPSDFHAIRILNRELDLYVPLVLDPALLKRADHSVFVYGRLKQGISLAQAQSKIDAAYRQLAQEYPATNAALEAKLIPLPQQWLIGVRPILLMLLTSVGFVLLICCSNVANLLLARAASRGREMAVRTALGAGRSRLIRQLQTESLLLAFGGGAAGLLLAYWGIGLLNRLVPYSSLSRTENFRLDAPVIGFALGISVLTTIIFGLLPTLYSSQVNLAASLRDCGISLGGRIRGRQFRNLQLIVQNALAVMLLIAGSLVLRSALRLEFMNRGLDVKNVLTMQIWLPQRQYPDGRGVGRFYQQVLTRIRLLPGVKSASAANFTPLAVQSAGVGFTTEPYPPSANPPQDAPFAKVSVITPDYFETMGIPLLAGRDFTEQDADERHGVVIISEAMARRFWPGHDPIGQRVWPMFSKVRNFYDIESANHALAIVGIVGDIRQDGTLDPAGLTQMYVPYLQNPSAIMSLLIRTEHNPLSWASTVQNQVWSVDKDQPVSNIRTMEDVVAETFSRPSAIAWLLDSFAFLALILTCIGIYGVTSYSVSRRTRELGIRMALGARSGAVLTLVLREGLSTVATGVTAGLLGALAVGRLLSSLLYGISSYDPFTYASVALVLAAVALLACYIPARRAMRVDPAVALRHE